MILLIVSFVAGVLTVLAPCILPLLPVVVGGSLYSGKVDLRKALTIIVSLGLSVLVFTFVLKVSTLFIEVPPVFWQLVSGGIIIVIGMVMLFPSLYEGKLLAKLSGSANILLGKGEQKKNFWGDVLVGASLGPVFSTCSPTYFVILATVLPVSPAVGVLYMLAYIVGLCGALLLVTFLGQKVLALAGIASDPRGIFKRVLGGLFLLVGIFVATGGDRVLQTALINSGMFDVTQIEQKLLQLGEPDQDQSTYVAGTLSPEAKARYYTKAPEISTPDGFVNTNGESISLESLRGKVVLLDVWTYSCINCQRTIPYLNAWYEKYKDDGLVIVGLHTPEFAFEKALENVQRATEKFGIKYPVVLDNDYSTWIEYGNRYWPRKYLIDLDGYIVYDHIGEGGYEETERAIRQALSERAARMGEEITLSKALEEERPLQGGIGSPETYFGALRNDNFGNGTPHLKGVQMLSVPETLEPNTLYLDGTWNFEDEYAQNVGIGKIVFSYKAGNVYMVASASEPIDVDVYQDGVFVKTVTIQKDELYTIMENETPDGHTLELRVKREGLKAFTFTFG